MSEYINLLVVSGAGVDPVVVAIKDYFSTMAINEMKRPGKQEILPPGWATLSSKKLAAKRYLDGIMSLLEKKPKGR